MKKKSRKKLYLFKWLAVGTATKTKCEFCNEKLLYFYRFDALCCPVCNIWNEAKCKDPECEFCKARPETPEIGLYQESCTPANYKELFVKRYSHKLKHQNHRKLKLKIRKDINQEYYK